ncbi:MAG TPA: GNAT family N-acetyltransferase [Alphaproteobacteria bacterium]|nr:GNAT family N-acetyltransferase [Alphaproteobacteria bacterium]
MSTFEFVDVSQWPQSDSAWDEVVAAAPAAWVWTTRLAHNFRLSTLRAAGELHADRSFFLIDQGRPVGLMPLVIRRSATGGGAGLEASYREAPLPWPSVVPGTTPLRDIEEAMLEEAETRCRAVAAGRLSLMLSPPEPNAEVTSRFTAIARRRGYLDSSYPSHWMRVGPETLSQVRERYRRDVRKFTPRYRLEVLSGNAIPDALDAEYMELHRKDAGTLHRPAETFRAQMDILRQNAGFITVARRADDGTPAGMLMIWRIKGAAYDASVAVDPQWQREQVSHLLKWRTIEHLLAEGTTSYELGRIAASPSYLWQPSDKNYGISFFKEGWARDGQKTVFEATKYFDASCLKAYFAERMATALTHQQLE